MATIRILATPCHLEILKLRCPSLVGFGIIAEELDMETGEVSVNWHDDGVDYQRKLFVSRHR